MIYLKNDKEINISEEEKPYGEGSEGKIYKKGNYIYKIYFPNMLNESHGNKEKFHQYLIRIPTKQVILPDEMLYSKEGIYQGYRTPFIPGAKRKKTGITQLDSKTFIKNLQILEQDFNILSNNYILVADISPINYIFNAKNSTMNIIDPGRYRHHCLKDLQAYHRQNNEQLNKLIELLLYLDFIEYKPLKSKKEIQKLKLYLEHLKKKESCCYSELFTKRLKNFENVDEYVKSLKKYI